MTTDASIACGICGKAAHVHVCEIHAGAKTNRSFCLEHAPAELRDKLPSDELAYLRQLLLTFEQQLLDPAQLATVRAEIEKLIADIKAGRRRTSEGEY